MRVLEVFGSLLPKQNNQTEGNSRDVIKRTDLVSFLDFSHIFHKAHCLFSCFKKEAYHYKLIFTIQMLCFLLPEDIIHHSLQCMCFLMTYTIQNGEFFGEKTINCRDVVLQIAFLNLSYIYVFFKYC